MRSLLFIALFALVVSIPLPAQQTPPAAPGAPAGPGLTITTAAWPDGDDIPLKYTQAVEKPVSPALTWTNVPAGTRSFVLHMHDPDVSINRTTNTQVHWLIYALDTMIDVPHGANEQETRAAVIAAMNGHILGKAVMVGLFKRPQ